MNMLALAPLTLLAASQAEAQSHEPIVVPKVERGDRRHPKLAVRIDGTILAGPRVLFDAGEAGTEGKELLLFLVEVSKRMRWEFREELGAMVPTEAMTVRCDENAPFASVARIVRGGSTKGIGVARLEFPVRTDASEGEQEVIQYETPVEILANAWYGGEQPESFHVHIRVAEPGEKLHVGDVAPGSRFEYDSTRRIEFVLDTFVTDDLRRAVAQLESLGRRKPDVEIVRISTDDGVTFAEVLRFYQHARREYLVDFTFAGD